MRTLIGLIGITALLPGMVALPVQAGKPVDNDGDGVTGNKDCDDNDASVWDLNSCGECALEPPTVAPGPHRRRQRQLRPGRR